MDKGYKKIILRSFDEDLSSAEQEELQQLLESSPSARRELEQLREMRQDLARLDDLEFSDSFEDTVMDAVMKEDSSMKLAAAEFPKKRKSRLLSWAASFVLLLSIGTMWWFQPISHNAENEAGLQLDLPDGTRVNLAKGSTLKYQRFALRNTRNVNLDGRAFFAVAKDPNKPFLVQSFNAEIEVTGTQFDVNTKVTGSDNATYVYVREGSVAVRTKIDSETEQASVQLSANQQTTVITDSPELRVTRVGDEDKHLASSNGGLVFDNQLMSEVVVELESRFGISFRAQSADILERRITYFEKSPESLDQIVNDISHALGLNYTKSPEAIIFMHPNTEETE